MPVKLVEYFGIGDTHRFLPRRGNLSFQNYHHSLNEKVNQEKNLEHLYQHFEHLSILVIFKD